MKNLNKLESKVIGSVSVDSGSIWIGDPCYILHKNDDEKPTEIGRTWSEFCDTLKDKNIKEYSHNNNIEGLGVCTSTKYGDGFYNVIGFFEPNSKRPSCVMIDFNGIFN